MSMDATRFVGNDVFQDIFDRWVDRKMAARAARATHAAPQPRPQPAPLHAPAAAARQRVEAAAEALDAAPCAPPPRQGVAERSPGRAPRGLRPLRRPLYPSRPRRGARHILAAVSTEAHMKPFRCR